MFYPLPVRIHLTQNICTIGKQTHVEEVYRILCGMDIKFMVIMRM